ncbi:MAG TPA: stage II sporulation protein R [Bacillales bacterium]|nr:stage II sporulation protein R [Bacillales bacterium]
MKRKAIILSIMILIVLMVNMKFQTATAEANGQRVKIPDQAIRLRILANSNSKEDQTIKRQVRDAVNAEIATWVHDLTSIDQARKVIRHHIPDIKQTVAKTLKSYHVDQSYKVTFGNVQFPTKIYGNYVYPAGVYEALLITLGKGLGANWWCVLFPPLCFLDFQNGDAVKTDTHATAHDTQAVQVQSQNGNDIHVKFFIVDWFSSLIHWFTDFIGGLFSQG